MTSIKRFRKWQFEIITTLMLSLISWNAVATDLAKGPLSLAGVETEVWGSYKIQPTLFPHEVWDFVVVVVPVEVRQGSLIKIAKDFNAKHPMTRVRFFSDKQHIQQYVDRDRYYNDSTGSVKEVDFPDSEWVQNHLLGNINNRSSLFNRHWMLEDRHGNRVMLLP